MRPRQQQARARGCVLRVRHSGGRGVHRARAVSGPHPADARGRVQPIPAQEPPHTVRRHRHPGRLRGPSPQQAGIYQLVDAPPHY